MDHNEHVQLTDLNFFSFFLSVYREFLAITPLRIKNLCNKIQIRTAQDDVM